MPNLNSYRCRGTLRAETAPRDTKGALPTKLVNPGSAQGERLEGAVSTFINPVKCVNARRPVENGH